MLEIIGWMLCVYMFLKGLELFAMKREEGTTEMVVAYAGGVVALLASVVFFVLVTAQAESTAKPTWNASEFGL